MFKSLVVLAFLSTTSAPVLAQTVPAANSAQPAKPQTVKKRVCETIDEDPSSRLGNRKICKTIEVPATGAGSQGKQGAQSPAPTNPQVN
jgi:hypothetical protein